MSRRSRFLLLLGLIPLVVLAVPSQAEPSKEVRTLVSGNTDFALRLYGRLAREKGNLFLSPHSISEAMAMAYAGAGGKTADDLGTGMGYGMKPERTPNAFRGLRKVLAKPYARRWPVGEPMKLHIANSFWADGRFPFLPAYAEILKGVFKADARTVDFQGAAEEARREINAWVGEKTEKKIPELLGEDALTPDTVLVLANAIYFKATWKYPFVKKATKPADFTTSNGSVIQVPTMQLREDFGYASGDGWQLVELPYAQSYAVMTILLPDRGKLPGLEERLDAKQLSSMLTGVKRRSIRLALPRIRTRSRFDLADHLADMGMASAFGAGADFSGMSEKQLFISKVIHEAMLAVDESGTEAAAATAVMMEKGRPAEPLEVKVDRPFLLLVRDTTTGSILFVGRIDDPGTGTGGG